MAIPSSRPAGQRVTKRTFSSGSGLSHVPYQQYRPCTETGSPTVAKMPRTTNSFPSSAVSQGSVIPGNGTPPSVCNKGCPKTGWTIDQFCEVCHTSSGHGVLEEGGASPWPLVAEEALAAHDHRPAPALEPPLGVDLDPVRVMTDCVKGNGLCPRGGWSISSYCPMCHG